MSTNDGWPALPTPRYERGDMYLLGMELRDYFAAKALQGLIANKSNPLHFKPEDDAAYCYTIADAMLAARSKT